MCLDTLTGHTSNIYALTVLPNGFLVSGSFDLSIKIWNPITKICVATLNGHANWVLDLAVLPDGRLVSGGVGGEIKIWDLSELSLNLSPLKSQTFGISPDSTPHYNGPDWIDGKDHPYAKKALANYFMNRENGDICDNPEWPFPEDGAYSWVNPAYQGELSQVRYDAGVEDEKWMVEKDRNYLARIHAEKKAKKIADIRDADGNTPLHLEVKKPSVSLAKVEQFIQAGADVNATNHKFETPLTAMTSVCDAHVDVAAVLLRERIRTTLEEVDIFLHHCKEQYQLRFELRDKNREMLDKELSYLLGIDVAAAVVQYNWIYLGHLHSLKGKFRLRNRTEDSSFEGFHPHIFLTLRMRALLELMIEIELNIIRAELLPHPEDITDHVAIKALVLNKLKEEFWIQIESFRAYYIIQFLQKRSISLSMNHGLQIPAVLLDAHARHIVRHINHQDTYVLPIAYFYKTSPTDKEVGHGIYVNLRKTSDGHRVMVRIDNLGEGSGSHDVESTVPFALHYEQTSGAVTTLSKYKTYPYEFSFDVIALSASGDIVDELLNYVRQLLTTALTRNYTRADEPLALIYCLGSVKPAGYRKTTIDEMKLAHDPKKLQAVGNCVVKNHQPGIRSRLSFNRADELKEILAKRKPPLYEFFRECEARMIPTRGIKKAWSLKGKYAVFLSADSESLEIEFPELRDMNTEEREGYFALLQASAQATLIEAEAQGLTPLHLAVVAGDIDSIRAILTSEADAKAILLAQTHGGYTPLHLAALCEELEIVDALLLEAEVHACKTALLDIRDNTGRSAEFYLSTDMSHAFASAASLPAHMRMYPVAPPLPESGPLSARRVAEHFCWQHSFLETLRRTGFPEGSVYVRPLIDDIEAIIQKHRVLANPSTSSAAAGSFFRTRTEVASSSADTSAGAAAGSSHGLSYSGAGRQSS